MKKKEDKTAHKMKSHSPAGHGTVKRPPVPATKFIWEEILNKISSEKTDILTAVNARLKESGETAIKQPELEELLNNINIAEAETGSKSKKRRGKTDIKEWCFIKYFILKEILKKGSIETGDLLAAVNARLEESGETTIKQTKLIELIEELKESLPLSMADSFIDSSNLAYDLLKNSQKDASEDLEIIAKNTPDPSLQILKLLWRFNDNPNNIIFKKLVNLEKRGPQKQKLVNKIIAILDYYDIHNVLIGAGVTMLELTRQLMKTDTKASIKSIMSSNTLILLQFLISKMDVSVLPLKVRPDLQMFRHESASLTSIEELFPDVDTKNAILKDIKASVSSYTSLSYENGFRVGLGHNTDIYEKLICLTGSHQHQMRLSIISTDWTRILSDVDGIDVVDINGEKSHKLLNPSNIKEYIIVTDCPENIKSSEDQARIEDLKKWAALPYVTVIDSDKNLEIYLKDPANYNYLNLIQ